MNGDGSWWCMVVSATSVWMCAKLRSASSEWSLRLEKKHYILYPPGKAKTSEAAAHFPAMLTQQEKWQQHIGSFAAKIHCRLMNNGVKIILNTHYLVEQANNNLAHSVVAIYYSFLYSFSDKSLLYNGATSWFKVADISMMEQQDIAHTASCSQQENTGYCGHQKGTSSFTNPFSVPGHHI